MKMRSAVFTILSLSLLLGNSDTSFAKPAWSNSSVEKMPEAFMKHEDINGDGKVSAGEFKGPKSDFEFFDANGDGIIELSEAPTPDKLPLGMKSSGDLGSSKNNPVGEVILNGIVFSLYNKYDFFTWKELPSDVNCERLPIQEFTGPDGVTHYYEAVYVASGNLNWFEPASLQCRKALIENTVFCVMPAMS